jgi:polysaccharide export outer membrane protein
MFKEIRRILALVAAVLLPGAAYAQPPASAPTPPVQSATASGTKTEAPVTERAAEYVLGPEDVIEFEVIGTPDKTRARIYADGTLTTIFGIKINAAGRTPTQLATDLANALKVGGFYAAPVVNVEVVGYASRYVTVLGAVSAPGLVPINRSYRLSEILARVGGTRNDSAGYVIVRPENGSEKRYSVDKLAAGAIEDDPFVSAGDKIFFPVGEIFYIYGQVKAPGAYTLRADMTVAQAIGQGGGLTESGSGKKVKVRRGGKSVTLNPDAKIEPGDVVTVRERLF